MFGVKDYLVLIWVLAHECGHQAFSDYGSVNDFVGWYYILIYWCHISHGNSVMVNIIKLLVILLEIWFSFLKQRKNFYKIVVLKI